MDRPRIVVVWGPHSARRTWSSEAEAVLASFAERVDVLLDPEMSQPEREKLLDAALADADGLVICGWGDQGIGYLSAERLARAPRLGYIGSTCHYRQAEFVDLKAAAARGIGLSETAPIMSPWVAEYELALALAALRHLPQEHGVVGEGGWKPLDDYTDEAWPDRLQGRSVGLASFGEVHRHLARFLAPFDVRWEAFDPFVPAEYVEAAGGRKAESLAAMAANSEIFFNALPPNPLTRQIVGRAVIDALPIGAVFVVVGRMYTVDQVPLLERLEKGEIRAAIDVYEPEPPPAESPLRRLPNVVHTPHRAGSTGGAHRGVFVAQCEEARRWFGGEQLRYPLRGELVRLFEQPRG